MDETTRTALYSKTKATFVNKFCYSAGDGTRLKNDPQETNAVFNWFFKLLLEKEEKIEDLENEIEALERGEEL